MRNPLLATTIMGLMVLQAQAGERNLLRLHGNGERLSIENTVVAP